MSGQPRNMKYPLAYLLLSSLLPASLATAEGPSTLSQYLIELSGRKTGICSMPRCTDGQLAVEVAHAQQAAGTCHERKAGGSGGGAEGRRRGGASQPDGLRRGRRRLQKPVGRLVRGSAGDPRCVGRGLGRDRTEGRASCLVALSRRGRGGTGKSLGRGFDPGAAGDVAQGTGCSGRENCRRRFWLVGRGHHATAGRRRRLDALRPWTGPEPAFRGRTCSSGPTCSNGRPSPITTASSTSLSPPEVACFAPM